MSNRNPYTILMEDIPQPSNERYSIGDRVRIYLDSEDPDSEHHGRVCEVTDVLSDDLEAETGRATDSHLYEVEDVMTGQELPVSFRHRDLVPVENPR